MTNENPFLAAKIKFDGNFVLQESFKNEYNEFRWFGIFEPYYSKEFYKYLEIKDYYFCLYDLENGFTEPRRFLYREDDFLFFNCCVIFNNEKSLMYNWFSEFLIVNDAHDIFLEIFGVEIDKYAEDFGGPFNNIRKDSSSFMKSLSNNTQTPRNA
ncbi:MAG: hypothetical protein IPN50_03660 [Sphingomonadales bacterium]|jgi:hypothetical protein|uniref:hypothetical protein n=1 Tax=Sphingorhabdus sp. TaxID=1902408 RepID=UPI003BB1CA3E|nr:hypothetical protein [Sphingomonadales bacterium]MBK9431542.1 hypothetical protein [Sphingomonadales bacterium]